LLTQKGEQKKDARCGYNKDFFILNIDTFKKFCLKACTKKADEIHNYFIKLESIMFEITHNRKLIKENDFNRENNIKIEIKYIFY
jgi:phage anti-repressor protein